MIMNLKIQGLVSLILHSLNENLKYFIPPVISRVWALLCTLPFWYQFYEFHVPVINLPSTVLVFLSQPTAACVTLSITGSWHLYLKVGQIQLRKNKHVCTDKGTQIPKNINFQVKIKINRKTKTNEQAKAYKIQISLTFNKSQTKTLSFVPSSIKQRDTEK